MPLIKASSARTSEARAFSLVAVEQEAQRILERARGQAERLIAEAQVAAERMRAQAEHEGRAEGLLLGTAQGREQGRAEARAQALEEAKADLSAAVRALGAATAAVDAAQRDLSASARQDVTRLALAVAGKIVRRVGRLDGQVLCEAIADVVRRVVDAHDVTLRICPDQRATLDAALPALQAALPVLQHVRILEDADVAAGGFRLDTAAASVDATLDAQLERLASELLPEQA